MRFVGKIAIAMVILASGSAVWADAPSTRPASANQSSNPPHNQTQNPRRLGKRGPGLFWMLGGGGGPASVAPATTEEWNEMMDFLSTNSPARWSVLSSLNLPNTSQVKKDAIRKWRNYIFYRQNFPAVADQMVQRFHLEDDLFTITMSAQEHPGDLSEFRDKIHSKVSEMVQVDFAERQLRIDKLEKLLESQKAKLAEDEQGQDQTVDQRTNAIMSRLERLSGNSSSSTTRPDGGDGTDQPATATEPHDAILNVTGAPDSGGK
jgi:hypothetical protein